MEVILRIRDVEGSKKTIRTEEITNQILDTVQFSKTRGRIFTVGSDQFRLSDMVYAIAKKSFHKSTLVELKEFSRLAVLFSEAEEAGYDQADYLDKGWICKSLADLKHWHSRRQRKKYILKILGKLERYANQDQEVHFNIGRTFIVKSRVEWCWSKAKHHLEIAADCHSKNSEEFVLESIQDQAGKKLLYSFPNDLYFGAYQRHELLFKIKVTPDCAPQICYEYGKRLMKVARADVKERIDRIRLERFVNPATHWFAAKRFLLYAYERNYPDAAYELYMNHSVDGEERQTYFQKAIELNQKDALHIKKQLEFLDEMEVAETAFESGDIYPLIDLAKKGYRDAIEKMYDYYLNQPCPEGKDNRKWEKRCERKAVKFRSKCSKNV